MIVLKVFFFVMMILKIFYLFEERFIISGIYKDDWIMDFGVFDYMIRCKEWF